MQEPIPAQKGPYVKKVEPGVYYWCACGRSKSQPFCDGAHKGTGIEPHKVEVAVAKSLAWCGCKNSATGAFCDGSHKNLP